LEGQPFLPACAVKLRILTAQRGGEIDSMRWADIDWSAKVWTIPSSVAKNGLSHRVPLSNAVLDLLMALKEQTSYSEWVFPSPFKPGRHIVTVRETTDRLRIGTGIDFVPHDLRRTAATYMTSIGVPRLVVSKLLNHVETGITRIYDRWGYDKEKREALELWGNRMIQIVS
jgi:integrase